MEDALFDVEGSDEIDVLLRELYKTEGWPVDPDRDRALIAELRQQFPRLNLADEFGAFRVWLLAQPPRERERMVKSRGRLQRLRNWCSRAVTGGPRSRAGSTRTGNRRTSTAARPVEAFGRESSASLGRW